MSPALLGAIALGVAAMAAGGGLVAATQDRMSGERWTRLLPETRTLAERLVAAAHASGLDVIFFDGWRSPAASAENIARGASKVAHPLESLHVWGAAFDLAFRGPLGPAWPPDDDPRWRQLAELGQRLGLVSGGLAWGWDWGHFQLRSYDASGLRTRYADDYLAFLGARGVLA